MHRPSRVKSITLSFLLWTGTFFWEQQAHPQVASNSKSTELQSLRKEIVALREAQAAMFKEIQELKTMLHGLTAPALIESTNGVFRIDKTDLVEGNPEAPLLFLEFGDYECSICAKFFREVLPQLKRDFIDTGKVKYTFCDFPLSIHKDAFKAAEAVHCAGEQGKAFEMRTLLFNNQSSSNNISNYARTLNLEMLSFEQCLDSERWADIIARQIAQGLKCGVKVTPSFALGFCSADGRRVRLERIIRGSPPYYFLKQNIEELLKSTNSFNSYNQ